MDSNTMNTCSRNSKERRNRTQCRLFSGSAPLILFRIVK